MRLYMKAIASCVFITLVLFTIKLHGDDCIQPSPGTTAMLPVSTFIYDFMGNWTSERQDAVINAMNEWNAADQANFLYITFRPCEGTECSTADLTLAMADLPDGEAAGTCPCGRDA